jgi:hypothetical protein
MSTSACKSILLLVSVLLLFSPVRSAISHCTRLIDAAVVVPKSAGVTIHLFQAFLSPVAFLNALMF